MQRSGFLPIFRAQGAGKAKYLEIEAELGGPTKISRCEYHQERILCVGPSAFVSVPLNPCTIACRESGQKTLKRSSNSAVESDQLGQMRNTLLKRRQTQRNLVS